MNESTILVSGATGRTGGAAIDELLQMGKRVRAYVRSDDERAAALRARGVDIAVGDFTDIDDIRAAMEGVSSAYFLHRLPLSCHVSLRATVAPQLAGDSRRSPALSPDEPRLETQRDQLLRRLVEIRVRKRPLPLVRH